MNNKMTALDTPLLERAHIIDLVRSWGGAASNAVLDPDCSFFSTPNVEGLISYKRVLGCAVVFGDPICPPTDIPILVQAFHNFCKEQKLRVIYIATTDKFTPWAIKNVCQIKIRFGNEAILNPNNDPRDNSGDHGRLVRRKVKHALNSGMTPHEYIPFDESLEKEIEAVEVSWLASRRGPQVYISKPRVFQDLPGKRWIYVRNGEKIVGVLVLTQLKAYQGWLINHMMIMPNAPSGTSELLVVTALDILKSEGCQYVTGGLVPAAQLSDIAGIGPYSLWMTKQIYRCASFLFNLSGHIKFWEKFEPSLQPTYLLFKEAPIWFKDIGAVLKALHINVIP